MMILTPSLGLWRSKRTTSNTREACCGISLPREGWDGWMERKGMRDRRVRLGLCKFSRTTSNTRDITTWRDSYTDDAISGPIVLERPGLG